ncbi:MAG: DNA repair protein RecO C-terminal domain-containing protein [Bacteroidales bacterium]|nr:DNA repair protein RecO C-terminal domain-containing protein [Bacteroidales bacterium]
MPSVTKSQAIVLHLTRQGDSGAVLHVIDSVAGRQGVFVRGLGKGRGVSTATFHSLAVIDMVTFASPKSSLLYLRECTPVLQLDGLRTDISKSTTALFISEVLYRSLKNDDGDPGLWSWLAEMIVALDSLQGSAANFHLWWMAGYCIKSGFRPNDNWSGERPVFDIVSAQFIPACGSWDAEDRRFVDEKQLFSAEDSRLLHLMLSTGLNEALAIPLSSSRRLSFARRMLDYLSYRFGCDLNVKSLDVLHEIFR